MDTTGSQPEKKECYAALDVIFPMGDDGLRMVSKDCWGCEDRVECMKNAMQNLEQKRQLEGEKAQRTAKPGKAKNGGFLSRWSRLKQMDRDNKNKS